MSFLYCVQMLFLKLKIMLEVLLLLCVLNRASVETFDLFLQVRTDTSSSNVSKIRKQTTVSQNNKELLEALH